MRRRIAVFDGLVLDVFEVASDTEHTYDYLYHNFGTLEPALTTTAREEPLGRGAGYQHMRDIRAASANGDWSATFRQEGANVRTIMLGHEGTGLFFGEGMANNPPAPCPMFVARRQGRTARFVTLIEPYREQPTVTGFRQVRSADGVLFFEVRRGKQRHRFAWSDKAAKRKIGDLESDGRVLYLSDTVE
jgi:hypothetical protein